MADTTNITECDTPRTQRLRIAALLVLLAASRLLALDHPAPIRGDEERFAAGAQWAAARWHAEPAGAYPVHHPGYPLWILLALPLHLAGLPPTASFMAWSVAASLIEPLILYRLVARFLSPAAAWWLAMAYGVSPVYWFLSATGLNYVAGSTIATGVALLALKSLEPARGDSRSLAAAAALCAVGVGLRPDVLLWIGPLLLWAARRRGRAACLVSAAALAFAALAWSMVIAGVYATGGDAAADGGPRLTHTIQKVLATSVFQLGLIDGLLRNAVKLIAVLGWSFGVGALIVAAAGASAMRRRGDASRVEGRPPAAFMILWIAPALAFNLFIHMTEPGHAIWHLPPLYLLAGALVARAWRASSARWLAVFAAASALQFALYPWSAASTGAKRILDAKVAYMSRCGLRQIDQREQIHQPGDIWRTRAHDIPD